MIRLSLWLPLELIIMCSSGEVAVGGTVKVAQQRFYVCVNVQFTFNTFEIYESTCCLLKHCTMLFRQEVNFPCLKQAVLLMGDENMMRTQKAFHCLSVACSVSGRTVETKRDAEIFFPVPLLAVSLHWQASISKNGKYTHMHTHKHASSIMPSLISQLQQIRTNVIVFDPKCAGALGKQWHFRLMPAVC